MKKVLCLFTIHVVTIYGIDAVANEIDVVLKFFDLGMKIQDFNIKIPRNVVDDFGL